MVPILSAPRLSAAAIPHSPPPKLLWPRRPSCPCTSLSQESSPLWPRPFLSRKTQNNMVHHNNAAMCHLLLRPTLPVHNFHVTPACERWIKQKQKECSLGQDMLRSTQRWIRLRSILHLAQVYVARHETKPSGQKTSVGVPAAEKTTSWETR
ncbi:hypothetical protein BKA80DRAFT_262231 [Phyllosticta citrichinensis]